MAKEENNKVPCCADAVEPKQKSGNEVENISSKFTEFLHSASSPHGLDAYTKEAIAIALSVAMRCEPCIKMHVKKAQQKGFTMDEIDEAAWMGIAFAGSPAMAFYTDLKNNIINGKK
jgi:AhpD family alkylhydroperoxidase